MVLSNEKINYICYGSRYLHATCMLLGMISCSATSFCLWFDRSGSEPFSHVAQKKKKVYMYRSVPLIRPPILYTTSRLKWGGGGLYSRMQLVSTISPPPKRFYASAMYAIRTLPTNYGDDFQDREYCSRTSRLQSCVVSLHRRRAASSTRGQ